MPENFRRASNYQVATQLSEFVFQDLDWLWAVYATKRVRKFHPVNGSELKTSDYTKLEKSTSLVPYASITVKTV